MKKNLNINFGKICFFCFLAPAMFFVGTIFAQESSPTVATPDMSLIDDVEKGFVSLFNGKNLEGWEQKNGTATYEVVDGTILGTTAEGSPNSFLCSIKDYENFDLRFEVKVDDELNSGVQIRSVSKPGYKEGRVHGPQVEIESGPGSSGFIYSEGTGRKWISADPAEHEVFKNGKWNHYRVLADGNRVQTWVNGKPIEDAEIPAVESAKGFIGLQVHGLNKKQKGPFKVQWQNIRIKELDGKETRSITAIKGTPTVDGKIEDAWKGVPRLVTSRSVDELNELGEGKAPATAWVRCMWDDGHLYCLAEVKDSKISVSGGDEWDRDGVEFFIDGGMERSDSYDANDAQYRTEAEGNNSAGSSSELSNYKSVVTKTETGYLVEACIKLDTADGKKIGFDVQVNNDPGEGRRMSVMKWNDPTNDSYMSSAGFGTLEMIEK
jgi:hypothetical protein